MGWTRSAHRRPHDSRDVRHGTTSVRSPPPRCAPGRAECWHGPRPLDWPPGPDSPARTLVVSFSRTPTDVLAGRHDAEISAFLALLRATGRRGSPDEREMDAKALAGDYAAPTSGGRSSASPGSSRPPAIPRSAGLSILTGWDFLRNRMRLFWPVRGQCRRPASTSISGPTESVAAFWQGRSRSPELSQIPSASPGQVGVWRGGDEQRAELPSRKRSAMSRGRWPSSPASAPTAPTSPATTTGDRRLPSPPQPGGLSPPIVPEPAMSAPSDSEMGIRGCPSIGRA